MLKAAPAAELVLSNYQGVSLGVNYMARVKELGKLYLFTGFL